MRRRSEELGQGELGNNERLVYLAVASIVAESNATVARRVQIERHPQVQSMSPPTVTRSLDALLAKGLVSHAPGYRSGMYCLGPRLPGEKPDENDTGQKHR